MIAKRRSGAAAVWCSLVAGSVLAAVGCSPSSTAANEPTTTSAAAPSTAPTTSATTTVDTHATSGTEAAQPVQPEPHELPPPTDGREMAAALSEAELAVRNRELTNAQLDSWGRRQQSLYRHLSFNPEWATAAVDRADPAVRDAVRLNWEARQSLSRLVNSEALHDELPAWRITAPLPPQTLLGYYEQAERDWGIQWEFLAAINLIETRMGRIQGVSTAGAIGPMQFLPTTWAECCEGDPTDPADAIPGAAKYLTIRGGPENMPRAIFGYNNSQLYVDAVTAYATVMMADERAYYGYHAWEIYFLSTEGLVRLPVGYEQLEPVPAITWLAENPDALLTG